MNDLLIQQVVKLYTEAARQIYGSILHEVILFGSCARGDYDSESDIDLMVLLNATPEEIPALRQKMRTTANALDLEYDCVISATFQSRQVFEQYKPASMFYQNIEREGQLVG